MKVEPKEPDEKDPDRRQTLVDFIIAATIRGPGGDSESAFQNTFEWTTGHHEVKSS